MFCTIRQVNLGKMRGVVKIFKKHYPTFTPPHQLLEALKEYKITKIYADKEAQKILADTELAQKFLNLTKKRMELMERKYSIPIPPKFEALRIDLRDVYGHFGFKIFTGFPKEGIFFGAGETMAEAIHFRFGNLDIDAKPVEKLYRGAQVSLSSDIKYE